MRLASPLPRRRAHPNLRGGFAKRGIDHVIGIGGNGVASSPMRKKSLPRKSSNRPLREPNKASSGETVRFCWRTNCR
jgi:hypothetical protein